MKGMFDVRAALLSAVAFSVWGATWAADPAVLRVEDVVRHDDFGDARLSPGGDYLAISVPLDDRTALAVVRLADGKRIGVVQHGRNTHVAEFEWAGPERLVYALGERYGELKAPQPTGELYAVDADGKHQELLVGYRAGNDRSRATHIQPRQAEPVVAHLVDPMPEDPRHVLIGSYTLNGSEVPYTRLEKMDVNSGRRKVIARSPVPQARFLADHAHQARFAFGEGADNADKLYYRERDGADWALLNDESASGRSMIPLGFSSDDRTAYLQAEETSGPDTLYAFDTAARTLSAIVRDDDCDIHEVLRSPIDNSPVGAVILDGKPRVEYFDPQGALARLHRSLQASFPGQMVHLGRASADGRLGLLSVGSDRNPGDLYLFDHQAKKAQYLFARAQWVDPEPMAAMEPIGLQARDGTALHGYLTLPKGSAGKGLPLVVYPHGGPIGIQDQWGFDPTVQLLASRGYAVLQVNYRGSSGYGRAFREAGRRQWGGAMQDDLTDATRWAIAQGVADPQRICIYGASYGGYAALMGAAKEPDLYRCAAGHVGVYDLPLIYTTGDTATLDWAEVHYEAVLGREGLEAVSPSRIAERIKIPVLLTAGREDETAPPVHTERMHEALRRAGVPVEAKIYPGEGHTFFVEADRIDVYRRLLDFLDRHIGARAQAAAVAPAPQEGG